MARIIVVSSAVMAKYKRFDPAYYAEDLSLLEEERKIREKLRRTLSDLRTVRQEIVEHRAKIAEMKKSGEVFELEL
jgi:hypothetical protein